MLTFKPGAYSKGLEMTATLINTTFIAECSTLFPLYSSKVSAGFPSPADDYIEKNISLEELIIQHPATTFLVKVKGHSMIESNIHDSDILVIDRSLKPQEGKIVVIAIDGELTVKTLTISQGKMLLMPSNPDFPVIEVNTNSNVEIWGVVSYIIHKA